MEAYRDGNVKAFDQLYGRFKDILYRYLTRQITNPVIAEEIFQDSWTAIIKNRHKYSVKSKFKTYLFHIAHNKLIDFYRSKHNSKLDLISYDDNNEDLQDNEHLSISLDHKVDSLNKYNYLIELLNKLPAAQRDVFLMHEETGMTLIEIAQVMDVSRDTVKSRLKYALNKLRNDMGHLK